MSAYPTLKFLINGEWTGTGDAGAMDVVNPATGGTIAQCPKAGPAQLDAALKAAGGGEYTSVLNGRFVGGYITRHYGQPQNNVHALQMELAWANYMDETHPYAFDEKKAAGLQAKLVELLQALLAWGKTRYGA